MVSLASCATSRVSAISALPFQPQSVDDALECAAHDALDRLVLEPVAAARAGCGRGGLPADDDLAGDLADGDRHQTVLARSPRWTSSSVSKATPGVSAFSSGPVHLTG